MRLKQFRSLKSTYRIEIVIIAQKANINCTSKMNFSLHVMIFHWNLFISFFAWKIWSLLRIERLPRRIDESMLGMKSDKGLIWLHLSSRYLYTMRTLRLKGASNCQWHSTVRYKIVWYCFWRLPICKSLSSPTPGYFQMKKTVRRLQQ